MFDFGYANYMRHAFPQVSASALIELVSNRDNPGLCIPTCPTVIAQDNLLPTSCSGQDWQGGMALTLVDALDALAVRVLGIGRGHTGAR